MAENIVRRTNVFCAFFDYPPMTQVRRIETLIWAPEGVCEIPLLRGAPPGVAEPLIR